MLPLIGRVARQGKWAVSDWKSGLEETRGGSDTGLYLACVLLPPEKQMTF